MLALEYILIGALSALGWWGSNHYIIEPYFPPPIERKKDDTTGDKNVTTID